MILNFLKKEKKELLSKGIEKTKLNFFSKLNRKIVGKSRIDDSVLDALEESLILSDVGVDTTIKIIENIENRVSKDKFIGIEELNKILKEEVHKIFVKIPQNSILNQTHKPHVIMVVGVNGVGKTTTIGKLAAKFKKEGFSVVLGAADTFRAAAIEQLKIWAKRVNTPIVHQNIGSDSAAVAFDTLQSAKSSNADYVIIDTAGRLHNKIHLMNELSKIKRVMEKIIPGAPHDVMLVLDASIGQNAVEQARQFIKSTQVNSIALTKLDGTAKGGVVLAIAEQFKIPVRYIGIGEGIKDLRDFNSKEFVDTLFHNE